MTWKTLRPHIRAAVALGITFTVAACWQDETISGYADRAASYVLVEPKGHSLTLRFPRKGRVSGDAGCGEFTARQGAPYPWVEFDRIEGGAGCAPFPEALTTMSLAEVSGGTLILTGEGGSEWVFQARP
ncbi:MAG: hypothetical protein AAGF74_09865 [Pseudomonadota bacterium]